LAGGVNLYAYAGNNPASYSDPFGLCPPKDGNLEDCQAVKFWMDRADRSTSLAGKTGNRLMAGFARLGMGVVADLTGNGVCQSGKISCGIAPSVSPAGGVGGAALADEIVVVRGGTSAIPAAGRTFSGAAGATLEEAASGVPHGTIRATTVGQIRQAGGTVESAPELTRGGVLNEKHVNICLGGGACPFGEAMPNPVPKAGRVE
jgi:hypothetical protein